MKKILLFPLRILAQLCIAALLLPVLVGICIISVVVILIALIIAVMLIVFCPIAKFFEVAYFGEEEYERQCAKFEEKLEKICPTKEKK